MQLQSLPIEISENSQLPPVALQTQAAQLRVSMSPVNHCVTRSVSDLGHASSYASKVFANNSAQGTYLRSSTNGS